MGALKEVWRNQHLDTYSKYLLLRAIPMNLFLCGCNNWSLQQELLHHLEVLLHCSVRRILHISITNLQDQHIKTRKYAACSSMTYRVARTRSLPDSLVLNIDATHLVTGVY